MIILGNLLILFFASLLIGGTFCTLLGCLTVFYWIKKAKPPNDESNRINNIKSWWLGLTRPDLMGRVYDDFRKDVLEQITD